MPAVSRTDDKPIIPPKVRQAGGQAVGVTTNMLRKLHVIPPVMTNRNALLQKARDDAWSRRAVQRGDLSQADFDAGLRRLFPRGSTS